MLRILSQFFINRSCVPITCYVKINIQNIIVNNMLRILLQHCHCLTFCALRLQFFYKYTPKKFHTQNEYLLCKNVSKMKRNTQTQYNIFHFLLFALFRDSNLLNCLVLVAIIFYFMQHFSSHQLLNIFSVHFRAEVINSK